MTPVCHVITRLDLGGAQENTLHTVRSLREPFRASLVCGAGGLLDEEAARIEGVRVTFLRDLVRPIDPWRDLRAFLALTRLFRRTRPRIVHTHSSKAGILGRAAARAAGVPIVVHTIHGFGFNDEQPAALRALGVALERCASPLATHLVAVSRRNLENGVALGLIDPARASVIRSGVRIDAFREAAGGDRRSAPLRAELGIPPDAPLVGMVACLKPQKAPLDFVEVAARVAAARPGAVFLMAGDGELRAAVEERARRRGLAGRLHLLGWRRDVPRVMAALDVVVLTSLWEGLPRVIPEAIAAGRPVVATAVDGTAEILRDGDNGFLCPPHDCDGLAARVLRLLDDPGLGERLAARARPILREFDIDRMVREQEDLYRRLLRAEAPAIGAPRAA
jgi:glycosyltransferase involved in cell wall biosynthesis